ncbi:threonine--tRNA ligase [Candidatus Woesearchaeota archaeon]|nr:threonine--tRNA ligase [Candidatus Woesearchaeota archaeon]
MEKKEKKKIDLDTIRHSCAHIMAAAVKELFPDAKPTIGPSIEHGYYYDFDFRPFTPEDLKKIEQKMREIIKKKLVFEKKEITKKEALEKFKDNKYKVELIEELPEDETITTYKSGDFEDLCRGPHVPDTSHIGAFKLTKVAGAYWRGDPEKGQLQRIYGTAFPTKEELKEHLRLLEEAAKRDHRKIGQKLELYSFHEEAPGMPFWHPKGMVIWNELLKYWREMHKKAGYDEVKTPIVLSKKLWQCSGHWTNFKEHMYCVNIDEFEHAIKPMNCPGGMLIYKERLHSYREFPIRNGEIGLVHRHELSGVLAGLFRVRSFHQDDAHIFMTPSQIKDEILGVIKLTAEIYERFNLGFELELSTRPEKSIGTDEQWETATKALKAALKEYGKEYRINEGDGAFYGPKIDYHIKDALGRTWQCGTIQLDMALPECFDLTYEGEDGKKHRPIMIHRTIYGSLERFIGVLVEHFAGRFPLWLSPIQVALLPIADRHIEFCNKLKEKMENEGLRVIVDDKTDTMSKKIRNAQIQQINYILVVGDKELENKTVNVRTREGEVLGEKNPNDFTKDAVKEMKERK